MGRILRSGGLLYFVILIVLAVVLVNMLSRGNPDVEELNSQQWKQAVQDKTFVTDLPKTSENYLTILDEDQMDDRAEDLVSEVIKLLQS